MANPHYAPNFPDNTLLRIIAGSVLNPDGSAKSPMEGNSGLPYGADNYEVTYFGSTNNPETIVFKLGTTVLKTRTLTYIGDGVADNDKLATSVDS